MFCLDCKGWMGKVSLGLVCLAHSIPWIQLYDFRGPLCPKTILLQLYWLMLKCACPVKAKLSLWRVCIVVSVWCHNWKPWCLSCWPLWVTSCEVSSVCEPLSAGSGCIFHGKPWNYYCIGICKRVCPTWFMFVRCDDWAEPSSKEELESSTGSIQSQC